jgi:Tfp pilus assembly major pilin PilA
MRYMKGITLLETMLAIAIAAVIMVASVHFYWVAKARSTVLQATSQIQRLVRAAEEWETAERLPYLSSESGELIAELVKAGLLKAQDEANPWGGSVSVTGDSDGRVVVHLDGIPKNSCQLLVSQFKTSASANDFSCTGKGGGDSWEGRF